MFTASLLVSLPHDVAAGGGHHAIAKEEGTTAPAPTGLVSIEAQEGQTTAPVPTQSQGGETTAPVPTQSQGQATTEAPSPQSKTKNIKSHNLQ